MNPFNLIHQYREYRAYNKYAHPFMFFAIDSVKNICQLALVTAVTWQGYSALNNYSYAPANKENIGLTATAPASMNVVVRQTANNAVMEVLASANDATATNSDVEAKNNAFKINGQEWINKLPAGKYTIQIESSPDKQLLYSSARSFTDSPQLAIYPFKKTPSNRNVYGLSTGLFDSFEQARIAVSTLPEEVVNFGVWIRPVGVLQKQIRKTLL